MRILLSNDDGYFAPGLAALHQALSPFADITVVAPERDKSGASNSLTLDRPLSVRRAGELSRPRPKHSNVPASKGSSTIVASGFMGAAKSGYVCPAEE